MKRIKLFLVFLLCFLLQVTVCRFLGVFGTAPNLILALVIIFSFFFDDFDGIIMGTIFGFIHDICFGPVIGISALVYLAIGMILRFVKIGVYRDNKIILFFLTLICTAVYYAGCWVLSGVMLDMGMNFIYVMKKVPVAIVWNYIVLLVVYYFARNKKGFTV